MPWALGLGHDDVCVGKGGGDRPMPMYVFKCMTVFDRIYRL